MAEKLLAKEVIFKEDLEEIFGKRQWDTEETVAEKIIDQVQDEAETAEIVTEEEPKNDQDHTELDTETKEE